MGLNTREAFVKSDYLGTMEPKEADVVTQGYDEYGRQPIDKTIAANIPAVRTKRVVREERDGRAGANVAAPMPASAPAATGAYQAAVPTSNRTSTRQGASALRWFVRILLLGCLVFGFLTIRYLTEQTVDQTSSLSGTAQDYAELGAYLVQSGQTPSAKADPVKWAAERILWVSYKLSNKGLDIRHQAHVVEFGLLGGVIALNVLAWMSGWVHRRDVRGRIHASRTALMVFLTLGMSMAASFADQYHKLSVPGRHFDKLDLALDASGYIGAIVVVFTVWGIISAFYRAIARK